MKSSRTFTIIGTVFAAAMSATALTPMTAGAADAVLSGTIKSADGAALGGATVSARLDGSNIVTSVFAATALTGETSTALEVCVIGPPSPASGVPVTLAALAKKPVRASAAVSVCVQLNIVEWWGRTDP